MFDNLDYFECKLSVNVGFKLNIGLKNIELKRGDLFGRLIRFLDIF